MIRLSRTQVYNNTVYGGNAGYYYTSAQASAACPPGFFLPDTALLQKLARYLNSPASSPIEALEWTNVGQYDGLYDGTIWRELRDGFWLWSSNLTWYSASRFGFAGGYAQWTAPGAAFSVRCVKL